MVMRRGSDRKSVLNFQGFAGATDRIECCFTKGTTITDAFRCSLAKRAILHRLPFGAMLLACLKSGGMGRGQLCGRFALFAIVRGDGGDLAKNSASHRLGFASFNAVNSVMHNYAHALHNAP
jgi:hypothetical protein